MIEVADECSDGAFEVDVVLPEGVVGIDEERLVGGKLGHEFYGSESVSTTWFGNGAERAGEVVDSSESKSSDLARQGRRSAIFNAVVTEVSCFGGKWLKTGNQIFSIDKSIYPGIKW